MISFLLLNDIFSLVELFLRRAGTKLASTLIKPDPPTPTNEEGGTKNPMGQFLGAITDAYVKVLSTLFRDPYPLLIFLLHFPAGFLGFYLQIHRILHLQIAPLEQGQLLHPRRT